MRPRRKKSQKFQNNALVWTAAPKERQQGLRWHTHKCSCFVCSLSCARALSRHLSLSLATRTASTHCLSSLLLCALSFVSTLATLFSPSLASVCMSFALTFTVARGAPAPARTDSCTQALPRALVRVFTLSLTLALALSLALALALALAPRF